MSKFVIGGFETGDVRDEFKIDKLIDEDHKKFQKIITECEQLRWKKINDYGITYNEFGYIGLLVKLGDKYGRIKRLFHQKQSGKKPNFETERDSLIDLINYSIMAVMELDKMNNDTTENNVSGS